jgi:hypothetical protein
MLLVERIAHIGCGGECTIRSTASHVTTDDSQTIDVRMYMGDDSYMYG